MAFYRCGGSNSVVTIDGVESDKSFKLESCGFASIENATGEIPSSFIGTKIGVSMDDSDFYQGMCTIVSMNGAIYCLHKFGFVVCYKNGEWSAYKNDYAGVKCYDVRWASVINGRIYAYIATTTTTTSSGSYVFVKLQFGEGTVSYIQIATPASQRKDYIMCNDDNNIYYISTYDRTLRKISINEGTTTNLCTFFESSTDYEFVWMELHNGYIYIHYVYSWSSTWIAYMCKYSIADNTWTKGLQLPFESRTRNDYYSGNKALDNNGVLYVAFSTTVGAGRMYHLFKYNFEDDVWTQCSKGDSGWYTSKRYFTYMNDEIWYLAEGGTARLGKMFESYKILSIE